jgi:rubrerythrin/biotin operon repressor
LKDDNYIVIQGWMVNRLKLSGNELMVYGIIFGFSQDGESKYEGSGKYIADSVGISRRAVSLILNSLVEKGYVKKFEHIEKGIKLCDYQAAAEYLPSKKGRDEEKPQGGMEKNSIGRKSFPYLGNNCQGIEEISIPRKKFPEGMEKDSIGGMEKISNHNTNTINIDIATATASQPPQPNTDPPPAEIPAAADPITPEGLKTALQAINKTLILSESFYPKAAAFMARYGLPKGYLEWMYRQCELKKPDSFNGLFFTLFFEESMAKQFQAAHQTAAPSPPPDIYCQVCGTPHAPLDKACPSCGLPKDSPPDRAALFRQLRSFTREKRDEYFRREQALLTGDGLKDFVKCSSLLAALQKEFGLATA